jgi:hypothetical protein
MKLLSRRGRDPKPGGGLASPIPLAQNVKFQRPISCWRNGGPGVQRSNRSGYGSPMRGATYVWREGGIVPTKWWPLHMGRPACNAPKRSRVDPAGDLAYRDALDDVRALLSVDPTVIARIRKANELFASITPSRLCEIAPHCSAQVADRLTHTFSMGKQPRMLKADQRVGHFRYDEPA